MYVASQIALYLINDEEAGTRPLKLNRTIYEHVLLIISSSKGVLHHVISNFSEHTRWLGEWMSVSMKAAPDWKRQSCRIINAFISAVGIIDVGRCNMSYLLFPRFQTWEQSLWSFEEYEEVQGWHGTRHLRLRHLDDGPFVVLHPDLATRDRKFLKTSTYSNLIPSQTFPHLHLLSLLIVIHFILLPQDQSTTLQKHSEELAI